MTCRCENCGNEIEPRVGYNNDNERGLIRGHYVQIILTRHAGVVMRGPFCLDCYKPICLANNPQSNEGMRNFEREQYFKICDFISEIL